MPDFPSPAVSDPDAGRGVPPRFSRVSGAVVVAVGGFDPTGGAGVVRDLLTARTLGARVRLVPTAWTAQSAATGVRSVEPRQPVALAAALGEALAQSPPETAVKLGMMPDPTAARAVLDALRGFAGPVVFDPVLGASSGGALFTGEPKELLALAARATLVTPNTGEAERLTGEPVADLEGAARAGRVLIEAGAPAALIKGGHLSGDQAVDLLITAHGTRAFATPRLAGPSVRGTGCALATAIAVALATGQPLEAAVASAKAWLYEALRHAVPVSGEWHIS
jgi:hydroxymethylpyrimidine kinase/phosphomethylpyrimidine kinase